MNVKQKITGSIAALVVVLSGIILLPAVVGAAECAGVQTALIECDQTGGENSTATNSGVWGLLLLVLNILTAGVGIAAVGGVVYAAILYTSASDRAEQVKQAKDILQNVAIGIAAYAGMYLLLNFLVPGGIFT